MEQEYEKIKCWICWAETYVKKGDKKAREEMLEAHYKDNPTCRP